MHFQAYFYLHAYTHEQHFENAVIAPNIYANSTLFFKVLLNHGLILKMNHAMIYIYYMSPAIFC